MKGVVLTEFLAFVSQRYGEDMVDDIIDSSAVSNDGAYTSVGTYNPAEFTSLCSTLAARTGASVDDLVRDFGTHLSDTFSREYHPLFERNTYFDFVESIENHIHVEVRKLYPDAELPTFEVKQRTATRLVMEYRSPRRMAHLAEGLLLGTAKKFGVQQVRIQTTPLDAGTGEAVRFTIDLG